MPTIDHIREDFALLDNWEDRYRYIIELGQGLPNFDDSLKTDANKVRGCVSQVWIVTEQSNSGGTETLNFIGTSDANIVRGLIAILFALYNGKSSSDILSINAEAELATLGLAEHLTPQRSNGLASMVERIRTDATALTPQP